MVPVPVVEALVATAQQIDAVVAAVRRADDRVVSRITMVAALR